MLGLIIAVVLVLVVLYYWNKQKEAELLALINQKYPKSCIDQEPCPKGQACVCPPEADKEMCQKTGMRCVSVGDVQSTK